MKNPFKPLITGVKSKSTRAKKYMNTPQFKSRASTVLIAVSAIFLSNAIKGDGAKHVIFKKLYKKDQ